MTKNDFLWVERYRPTIVEDCILPDSIKNVFKGFVSQKEIPNLLLSGSAGVGKTTIAKALCDEIGCLLYTSPSPRDRQKYRMPSSA